MKKETKSFRLIPVVPFLDVPNTKKLENYLNIILSELKEEGGKYNFFTQTADYRKSGKIDWIKNLFENKSKFNSIKELKDELKKGGLEKTANLIEIQPLNKYGIGKIIYKATNGNWGDFSLYILEK